MREDSGVPAAPRQSPTPLRAASLILAVVGAVAVATSAPLARRSVSYPTRTMGTYAHVVIVTADSVADAARARRAHATFARIDSLMTNWTAISEVARLNRAAAAGPTTVDSEVATVIEAAVRVGRESHRAFDITVEPLVRLWGFIGGPRRVPTDREIAEALRHVGASKLHFDPAARTLRFDDPQVRIDLGGIAKGYAVDVVAESLRAQGVSDALVDLSGNMMALGNAPGADGWRIGIRDPRDRMPSFARVRIRAEAISTSGQYEQFVAANGKTYGHILDARTGRPAEGLLSVTVVAPSALDSDAWDTPLFVLGPTEAKALARERADIAVVLVQPGEAGVDTVWVEEALRGRFVLEPAARELFRVIHF